MEIIRDKWGAAQTRGPKQVGGYLLIKNPTPEVLDLLEQMRQFKFNEGGISFKMICKNGSFDDSIIYDKPFGTGTSVYASVGWKLGLVDRTMTLEERVKEIQ